MSLATLKGDIRHHARRLAKRARLERRRLYIVRRSDGRVWKGPYKQGWTRKPKEYYLFATEHFARHALKVTGEEGDVQRVV